MQTQKPGPAALLQPFVRQNTVLLTTFRWDGRPVGTPVHIAVEGDHAYVRTWNTAGKMKWIRVNPLVEIASSTIKGTLTGAASRPGRGS
jgi:PPOX class probable F420-dependent enzyme